MDHHSAETAAFVDDFCYDHRYYHDVSPCYFPQQDNNNTSNYCYYYTNCWQNAAESPSPDHQIAATQTYYTTSSSPFSNTCSYQGFYDPVATSFPNETQQEFASSTPQPASCSFTTSSCFVYDHSGNALITPPLTNSPLNSPSPRTSSPPASFTLPRQKPSVAYNSSACRIRLQQIPGQTWRLWEFLLQLLLDPARNERFIHWTGNGWEFKLSDPERVAQLWGQYKHKPRMNYDKLARSLRFYYAKNIVSKLKPPTRYLYRFESGAALEQLFGADVTPQRLFEMTGARPRPASPV